MFDWPDAGAGARSEFFRPQHGHDEVGEAAEREETDEECFHKTGIECCSAEVIRRVTTKYTKHTKGAGYGGEKAVKKFPVP